VIYRGKSTQERIQILERKNFKRIHILGLENIFAEQ